MRLLSWSWIYTVYTVLSAPVGCMIAMVQTDRSQIQCRPRWDCFLGAGSILSTLFCLHLLDAWLLWFKQTGLRYSVDPDGTAFSELDLTVYTVLSAPVGCMIAMVQTDRSGIQCRPRWDCFLGAGSNCLHCSVCTCWMHDCYGSNRQVWDTV